MVSDPRCPECDGKVSSTATWCMHCGVDFDHPVEADSGAPVDGRAEHRRATTDDAEGEASTGATLVGVILAVLAVGTLPLVAPPNTLLFVVASALGIGYHAASQQTPSEAARAGGTALAAAPFVVLVFTMLFVDAGSFTVRNLLGPLAYAVVVGSIARRFD